MARDSTIAVLLLILEMIIVTGASNLGEDNSDMKAEGTHGYGHGHGHGHHGHGHGHHHHGHGKFFMYAHQPSKKQYEFGYKRGNDHHSIERYEKAGPKHNFKTKVRWHDSKGGHGEHYWDYNHSPKYHDHHDDHHHDHYEHHHHKGHGYGHGHNFHHGHHDHHGGYHSHPVPDVVKADRHDIHIGDKNLIKRQSADGDLKKEAKHNSLKREDHTKIRKLSRKDSIEEEDIPSAFPSLLGYDPYTAPVIAQEHQNAIKPSPIQAPKTILTAPKKRLNTNNSGLKDSAHHKSANKLKSPPKLAYDLDTGNVYEENTDVWYKLIPIP